MHAVRVERTVLMPPANIPDILKKHRVLMKLNKSIKKLYNNRYEI